MQYSLLSRFRGTLLGAVIAEGLGSLPGTKAEFPLGNEVGDLGKSQKRDEVQLSQVVWLYAETLIKAEDLNIEALGQLHGQLHGQQANTTVPLTPAEILVGIIPVGLFFHEDQERLRQKTLQVTAAGHATSELQYGALAVAYVIAQSLREQLNPATLIAQTIAYLLQPSLLVKQLEQVQKLLEQRAGLDTALSQLLKLQSPSSPIGISIALAFYCFLSTLADYQLTVVRAARTGHQLPLTAILAGALSGAYNSIAGIPPGYRLLQESHPRSKTETIMLIADQLLATWSGAYEPTRAFTDDLNSEPAVAAPGMIRPRI